jgi:hypothetical protein
LYIYETKNLTNHKTYIGQRKCPANKTPKTDNYMGSGKYLKRAFQKYGKEKFYKRILIKDIYCKEIINQLEKDFIAIYRELGKAEYNITDGGEGYCGKFSEEHKQKISVAHKGKKFSEEHKNKLRESLKGNNYTKGKHWKLSKKSRIKMSEAHKGIIPWNKGKSPSEETRRKLSENIERNKKISEARKGKHWFSNGVVNK